MAGIKRIITGLLIMSVGLYYWYDTMNETIPEPNSKPIMDPIQIIDSTFLMGILGAIVAIGVVIFAFGVRASRR